MQNILQCQQDSRVYSSGEAKGRPRAAVRQTPINEEKPAARGRAARTQTHARRQPPEPRRIQSTINALEACSPSPARSPCLGGPWHRRRSARQLTHQARTLSSHTHLVCWRLLLATPVRWVPASGRRYSFFPPCSPAPGTGYLHRYSQLLRLLRALQEDPSPGSSIMGGPLGHLTARNGTRQSRPCRHGTRPTPLAWSSRRACFPPAFLACGISSLGLSLPGTAEAGLWSAAISRALARLRFLPLLVLVATPAAQPRPSVGLSALPKML